MPNPSPNRRTVRCTKRPPHQAGEPLGSISHADCVIEVCRCRRCWLIVVREENSEEEWHTPNTFVMCRYRAARSLI